MILCVNLYLCAIDVFFVGNVVLILFFDVVGNEMK